MSNWKNKTRGGFRYEIYNEDRMHGAIYLGKDDGDEWVPWTWRKDGQSLMDSSDFDLTPAGPWKPEEGYKVWSVSGRGDVRDILWSWNTHPKAWEFGNVYRTEADATRARDAQILRTEIDRWIEENEAGVDWEDMESFKYAVIYQYPNQRWEIAAANRITRNPFSVYVSSQHIAIEIVNKFGDRMRELLL